MAIFDQPPITPVTAFKIDRSQIDKMVAELKDMKDKAERVFSLRTPPDPRTVYVVQAIDEALAVVSDPKASFDKDKTENVVTKAKTLFTELRNAAAAAAAGSIAPEELGQDSSRNLKS